MPRPWASRYVHLCKPISERMNDRQNTVVATVVAGLALVLLFLCPWRVESTEEIKWSPIYQPPMSYVRSYDDELGSQGSSRIESEEAQIAVDVFALEVLAVAVAGGVLYVLSSDSGEADEPKSPPLS